MDYSQFLLMKEELSLIAVIVILFIADLFMSPDAHKNDGKPMLNTMLPVALLIIHTLITIVPGPAADAFGGMYHNQPIQSIVKSILSVGTLIVFLMAHEWMRLPDTAIKQGEFYILTLSTLLGMYFMISAGHFLMFFIGLETASIPMAALVAFDKYRHHSAEAGAKYILTGCIRIKPFCRYCHSCCSRSYRTVYLCPTYFYSCTEAKGTGRYEQGG